MTTTIAPTTNAGIEAERAFDFLRTDPRSAKLRHEDLTEIGGPAEIWGTADLWGKVITYKG